jgi:hypothetical protein
LHPEFYLEQQGDLGRLQRIKKVHWRTFNA